MTVCALVQYWDCVKVQIIQLKTHALVQYWDYVKV